MPVEVVQKVNIVSDKPTLEIISEDKITPAQRVIKNSLWLIIQPFILNFISIFVTGYIARTLGQADYGKFVFAFSFIGLFAPLVNPGLRAITVREIAENRKGASVFLGKMLMLRFCLSIAAFLLTLLMVNMMHFPMSTKIVVYFASLTIIFNVVTTTFKDAFQAFERMKYVAYTEFISGFLLTALSVIVLFIGYRLMGLTLVYVFGSFLAMAISTIFLFKKFIQPKIKMDYPFWKSNFRKGLPFFIPNIISSIGDRFGIIFLSKLGGDISLGIFGAANTLVSRLVLFPDSICTAFFPTMSALYQKSKEDATRLFQRFFTYLLILGLPAAVGMTVLAKPIVDFIYGPKYQSSILILQILAWYIFVDFINSIQGWTLGAIHLQSKGAKATLISKVIFALLCVFFIWKLAAVGLCIAALIAAVISFILHRFFIRKYLTIRVIDKKILMKIIFANIAMGYLVYLLREYNVFLCILAVMLSYIFMILFLRIVSPNEIAKLRAMLTKRQKVI